MNKIKLKRGVAKNYPLIILEDGELFYDTQEHKLYVGDGITPLGQLDPLNSSGSGGGKIIQNVYSNYIGNILMGTISNSAIVPVVSKISSLELKGLSDHYTWAIVPNEGITINSTLVTNPVANSVMLYSTNKGISNSWCIAKVNFGNTANFYINAYAEKGYDYTLSGFVDVLNLDTSNNIFNTKSISASPTTFGDSNYITCNYSDVTYTGNNFVLVGYYKDGNTDSYLDTGFIIIKEEDMEDGFVIYDENNNIVYTKPSQQNSGYIDYPDYGDTDTDEDPDDEYSPPLNPPLN